MRIISPAGPQGELSNNRSLTVGRKPYQVSGRNLDCSVELNNGGRQNTQVELIFSARNPMDYKTVTELIERTKTAIRQVAMEAEPVDSY